MSPCPRRACLHAKQISVSGQYCFNWVQYQASFQMKFFMSTVIFNILSHKCLNERKFAIESPQHIFSIMSKNGANRWCGCWGNRCFVMKGSWIIQWVKVSPIGTPWYSLETGCIFTEFFVGDKCKYTDFRNITNFEIHMLSLVAGLLEDKAFRKGLVNVYIVHQPIALSKTGQFQNNPERRKKS